MSEFILRSHETADYKRCKKKWYWKWRRGLVLKARKFGALDLGTWMHSALADWYLSGLKRRGNLADCFAVHANTAISHARANAAPDHELDKAEELAELGLAVAGAYAEHYGEDTTVDVVQAEIPLDFEITDTKGTHIAWHKLKPDLVYRDRQRGGAWLMEHKTATQIRTGHLPIDGQARPYGVMAERALRMLGVLKEGEVFKGIMYNFLRKVLPDERPYDAQGRALNKNGSVSARQPGRQFLRYPVVMSRAAKLRTLQTVAMDAVEITAVTQMLRTGETKPESLSITPDKSCERFCDYFSICVASEQGADIRSMIKSLYNVQDPYVYDEETTDEQTNW